MAFKIETKQPPKLNSKYPFVKMKINDSFLAEGVEHASMASSCNYAAKILGFKFKTSKEENGIRVYRIK